MLELEALQAVLPQIGELGASLVAISPQRLVYGRAVRQRAALEFDVLSDQGLEVAQALVWRSRCRRISRSSTGHSATRSINFTANLRIAFPYPRATSSTGKDRFAPPT